MSVEDDVRRLASQEILYLAITAGGLQQDTNFPTPPRLVYRGRLREAANTIWVFNTDAFDDGDRALDVILGGVVVPGWASSEDPQTGIQIIVESDNPPHFAVISATVPTELQS